MTNPTPTSGDTSKVCVRGTSMRLATGNRSLALCAQMNYETENLDFIDAMAPGQVLYDLGACEGRFALYAAIKGIRTIALEPERQNFQTLVQNVALNFPDGTDRLTAMNLAVGATTHQGTLDIGQDWAGGHQKVVRHGASRQDLTFDPIAQQSVRVVALDELIQQEDLPQPDCLKVDVDGSEQAFIDGARQTLSGLSVRALIIELLTTDPASTAIRADLTSLGYRVIAQHPVPHEPNLANVVFAR